ncbi:hypothetical protein KPL78_22070 [Roseomonas sp. HJA6]|uniref:Chemoreceptor glutamine deamidase CheD n=1 Tax=Roseomonas alba TaxID=2846776 RepID=A0ABS7AFP4_9PROT|nr:hypothetical protein [Neoroseomonas alba]MBW6400562.1 hypothetical protein [Neoroseomonas alba]
MARFCEGSMAPYNVLSLTHECTWVMGSTAGTLGSTSFGSCVGLVLWCPATKEGVVAHYAGSLGHPTHQAQARDDTQEILLKAGTAGKAWNAWVFGGMSLSSGTLLSASSVGQTKQLIDLVRAELSGPNGFTHQLDGYPGYGKVSLDLATGEVTLSVEASGSGSRILDLL